MQPGTGPGHHLGIPRVDAFNSIPTSNPATSVTKSAVAVLNTIASDRVLSLKAISEQRNDGALTHFYGSAKSLPQTHHFRKFTARGPSAETKIAADFHQRQS
ncbi:hypothetical protein [Rhizobium sp. RU36D]|uniref:hypothetical protein n=1 Tax=Rhizobium sp. RU36D TaxID=1907415 RepID=UPI00117B2C33|nr:hypothetical protein [Rhizobium sp. RU36D]